MSFPAVPTRHIRAWSRSDAHVAGTPAVRPRSVSSPAAGTRNRLRPATLLGLRQLVAHVDDELLENLLRVLGARDQIVDVRPDQRGQTINDPHGSLCSWR